MGICTACNSLDLTTERPAKKIKLKNIKDNNITSRSMVLKLDKLSNILN